MEGGASFLSNLNLFVKEKDMQFVLGGLSVLCLVLIAALAVVWIKLLNQQNKLFWVQRQVTDRLILVEGALQKIPAPVQNIIHLGLKENQMTTGVVPSALSVRPEDFQIRVERLEENLMKSFESETHSGIGTRAYCILDKAGVDEFIDNRSFQELKSALTRLLTNGDDDAIKRFLKTVANSICQVDSEAPVYE